ncbi:MAG: hypothetical protein IJ873_06460 [Lachnospiraceae bacterium]|nr:hypothetical protein [Lachnospiraceae bacterium]
MPDVVDRLINGFFEYESEKLLFSVPKIEAEVVPGTPYEGSVTVKTEGGGEVTGFVYTSSMRVVCTTPEFTAKEFEIKFGFDPTGLEVGAIVKGDIQIVSNAGEYFVPFVFTIVRTMVRYGSEDIKNLFHFSNTAQTEWDRAVNLFYSDTILPIFSGSDRIFYDIYRGFSTQKGDAENVDRFLTAIKKKKPIELSTEKKRYDFQNITTDLQCNLSIKKNTWGHAEFYASTDAAFIQLSKEHVLTTDFLGNIYNMEFLLEEEKLHEGENCGYIFCKTPDGTEKLRIEITARRRLSQDAKRLRDRELMVLTGRLTRIYISFRMKQIGKGAWIRDSMRIVERMNSIDEKNPASRLYQAQLLLMEDRGPEAKWILEHIEREMKIRERGDEYYSYYQYLVALYNRNEDYIDKIAQSISNIYKNTGKFRILWLLMYLDAELSNNGQLKLSVIKEQFQKGCKSPLLYIEAYNCYVLKPELLTELSEFELSVIYFALKNHKYDREVIVELLALADKVRNAPPLLLRVLITAAAMEEEPETLRVLCALLIKDNKTEAKYFPWYQKGVDAELKITKLYEYYMYSIPFDHRVAIPKQVILYFGFQNHLSDERMAFLYANLIRHRGRHTELYESNLDRMREFAVNQIEQERMSRDLMILYNHVLHLAMITPKLSKHFIRILFSYEIAVPDEDITGVVLIEEELKGERRYPVEYGYAYPVVFSKSYTVFLEDKKGRRTLEDPIKLHRVMDDTLYLPEIRNFVEDVPGFYLYLCTVRNHFIQVSAENVEYCRFLVDSEEILEPCKADIRMGFMKYYYDNGNFTTLDEYLTGIPVALLKASERAEYIDYLIRRGMYERAYETITIYGAEELPAKTCVRICSHMIAVHDDIDDPRLVKFAGYAFENGKYDLLTLKYLIENFKGLTKELRNLWRAAKRFDVDSYFLIESLLTQMMFTKTTIGEADEVFTEYAAKSSASRVELAYLSYQAYEYFAKDRLLGDTLFTHMIKNYQLGEEINDAVKLALLKHFSEEENAVTPRISEMLCSFLIDFLHRNIYYNFFKEYRNILPELSSYEDKTIIEYRTNPAHRVILHYLLEDSEAHNDQYVTEEMRCLFGGVFVKEFVLFFGESLQYYIMEEENGEEKLTFSNSVGISETISGDDSSRYHMLNDMAVARNMHDYDTFLRLIEEYSEKDYFTEKAFSVL